MKALKKVVVSILFCIYFLVSIPSWIVGSLLMYLDGSLPGGGAAFDFDEDGNC